MKFIQAYPVAGHPHLGRHRAERGGRRVVHAAQPGSGEQLHRDLPGACPGLGRPAAREDLRHGRPCGPDASYGQAVYANSTAHPYTAGIAYHGYAGQPRGHEHAFGEQHLTEWRSLVTESLDITMAGMAGGYVAGRRVKLGPVGDPLESRPGPERRAEPGQARQARRGDREQPDGRRSRPTPEYYALAHLSMFAQPGALAASHPRTAPRTWLTPPTRPTSRRRPSSTRTGPWSSTSTTGRPLPGRSRSSTTAPTPGSPPRMVPGELPTFVW